MRDSLAAKAARHSLTHKPDCGTCDNCKEVASLKADYDKDIKKDRAKLKTWLMGSRILRCTNAG